MTTTQRSQADAAEVVDGLIATMVERIAEAVQPIQIWLFGSQARGDADEWSDVDLLVVLNPDSDRSACRLAVNDLFADIPIRNDVLFTTPEHIVRRGRVGGTVLNNALEEGRLVYEDEDPHIATAVDWLQTAGLDLEMAEYALSRVSENPGFRNQASWGAQQAFEKSVKAALFLEHIRFPRSHMLDELAELLPDQIREWTAGMELRNLSYRGLGGRYPDWGPNPTVEEARQALSDARHFYDRVAAEFERRGLIDA